MMWPDSIKAVIEMVAAGVSAGLTVAGVGWWMLLRKLREEFSTKAEHVRSAERLGSVDRRLQDVENSVAHLPTHREIAGMTASLSAIEAHLNAIDGKVDATQTQINILIRNEMGHR